MTVWIMAFVMMARASRPMRLLAPTVLVVVLGQSIVWWWWPHYAAPLVPPVLGAIAVAASRITSRTDALDSPKSLAPVLLVVLAIQIAALPVLYSRTLGRGAASESPGPTSTGRSSSPEFLSRSDVKRHLERQDTRQAHCRPDRAGYQFVKTRADVAASDCGSVVAAFTMLVGRAK